LVCTKQWGRPFARNVPREKLSEYRAIRTSRYSYVRGLQGPWLLFDDQKDAYQAHNLIGKEEFASLTRELDDRLQAQLKRLGDDFRPGRDYIAEWGYEIGPHGSVPYAASPFNEADHSHSDIWHGEELSLTHA
jgi:hypothetical protein